MSVRPSVCAFVCLEVRMSVCPYARMPVCPYLRISVCQSGTYILISRYRASWGLSPHLASERVTLAWNPGSSVHMSACLYVRLFVCPSVHMSVRPYVRLSVSPSVGMSVLDLHPELEVSSEDIAFRPYRASSLSMSG